MTPLMLSRTLWFMAPVPALLTTAEVAEELRVTPKTVRQWIDEGKLPAITLPGGTLRIRRTDFEAILHGVPEAVAS